MERRAFLKLLCIGAGVVAAAAPAEALTSFVPLAAPDNDLDLAPQPGVATSKTWSARKSRKHGMVIGVALIGVIGAGSVAAIITDLVGRCARRSCGTRFLTQHPRMASSL